VETRVLEAFGLFPGAQGREVFSRLRAILGEQLHGNSLGLRTPNTDIKENLLVCHLNNTKLFQICGY
jgi:hypothetical protein